MWTEAQLDWMRHLVRLNVDRVQDPKFLNVHDVKRLKWEIKTQRTVLDRIAAGLPLDDVSIPMARYMRIYADLHLNWYGGRMAAADFRDAMLIAKKRMWVELREARNAQTERSGGAAKMETMVETAATAPDEASRGDENQHTDEIGMGENEVDYTLSPSGKDI